MSTKPNKQTSVICEDEELYGSLKRALGAAGDIGVDRFTKGSLKNKNIIVLLATLEEENVRELIYNKIRSRYLNPIAIVGYKNRELFMGEHLLFRDHPYNHCYMDAPFDVVEFVAILRDMVPISSQAIREAICGSDPGYKGYLLKLLSHDLLSEKKRCVEILMLISDYLKDEKLSEKIEEATNKIKTDPDWSAIASRIGGELKNRIK